MPATLSSTLNYSGMLYTKTDESTRFLDAVYMRGKNGGRTQVQTFEFVLSSGYEMDDPEQPNISEVDAMTAPAPETTVRSQEWMSAPVIKCKKTPVKKCRKVAGGMSNMVHSVLSDRRQAERVSKWKEHSGWISEAIDKKD